jgi:hypothetical protein
MLLHVPIHYLDGQRHILLYSVFCFGLGVHCDSDVTDLRYRFQHRYPIAATTHIIADHR